MNNWTQRFNKQIKKFYSKVRGRFESPLPRGMTEFNAWADSIIETYDIEGLADKDSLRFVLANIILELKPDAAFVSKWLMARRLLKAASNQVASGVFQEIKAKQKEAQAQAAAKPAEATATLKVVANEQVQK